MLGGRRADQDFSIIYEYRSTLKFFNQFWDTLVGFLQNAHFKDM